jgi:hypothetical protein
MFEFEVNEAVILESQKALEAALSTSPKAQTVLRKIIRKYVMEARAKVTSGIKFENGDPRGAARAVRTAVYKKVLGANINIFNSRKAHGSNSYEPPRKGVPNRGGNRRVRGARTSRIMSYDALDRGFILRWLNEGVNDRKINFKSNENRKVDKWNQHPNTGNRGSIAPRNFFRPLGDRAMGQMRDNLAAAIEAEMQAILSENLKTA